MTIVYEDRGDEASASDVPVRRIRFSVDGE